MPFALTFFVLLAFPRRGFLLVFWWVFLQFSNGLGHRWRASWGADDKSGSRGLACAKDTKHAVVGHTKVQWLVIFVNGAVGVLGNALDACRLLRYRTNPAVLGTIECGVERV